MYSNLVIRDTLRSYFRLWPIFSIWLFSKKDVVAPQFFVLIFVMGMPVVYCSYFQLKAMPKVAASALRQVQLWCQNKWKLVGGVFRVIIYTQRGVDELIMMRVLLRFFTAIFFSYGSTTPSSKKVHLSIFLWSFLEEYFLLWVFFDRLTKSFLEVFFHASELQFLKISLTAVKSGSDNAYASAWNLTGHPKASWPIF